jgi:hypothetical protein
VLSIGKVGGGQGDPRYCPPTAEQLRTTLVDDWWEAVRRPDAGDAVMIAHRRTDVADLNALASERMRRDGRLGDEEVRTDRRAFAVGDRVIARRNNRRAGVVNGTRADVIAVDARPAPSRSAPRQVTSAGSTPRTWTTGGLTMPMP